jgi:salicylate hydroxylase
LSLAIVGAGPAGLTAAIAAAQHGLKPTVFERADVIARVGGGIVVHSNGLRVLDRLGLLDSFKPIMIPCNTLTLQLSDGHELVTDYSALPIPHNYFAVVLRHQLHTFLLAAAEKVATIHLGRHCTAIEELSDHVRLSFDSGEPVECGIVLGADGVHSTVRKALPSTATTRTAGDAYLRGVSECESDVAEVRESGALTVEDSGSRRSGTAKHTSTARRHAAGGMRSGEDPSIHGSRVGDRSGTWSAMCYIT